MEQITMDDCRHAVAAVGCPRCCSSAGELCTFTQPGSHHGAPLSIAHFARIDAWRALVAARSN
jgi:hypothetical protein